MKSEELFSLYASMAEITRQMLEAARAGDWDLLCAMEPLHAGHVEALRGAEPSVVLDASEKERKSAVIMKIMADISEIGAIAQPRMTQLAELLHSVDVEQKLSQAYRAY